MRKYYKARDRVSKSTSSSAPPTTVILAQRGPLSNHRQARQPQGAQKHGLGWRCVRGGVLRPLRLQSKGCRLPCRSTTAQAGCGALNNYTLSSMIRAFGQDGECSPGGPGRWLCFAAQDLLLQVSGVALQDDGQVDQVGRRHCRRGGGGEGRRWCVAIPHLARRQRVSNPVLQTWGARQGQTAIASLTSTGRVKWP